MTPGLSLYLDLLRVMAAFQVVVYHLGKVDAAGFGQNVFNAWGHEAVVVFFVLSGFVISHTAHTSDRTFRRYASSRISRLYSVVLPCLAITVVLDSIGMRLAPQVYDVFKISDNIDVPFARLIFCLLMLSESWVSVRFFSIVPFWSLCYEFWYYVLFGCCFYFTGAKRVVLVVVAALISGPRILLLFPIWLMGVAAYKAPVRLMWSRPSVWLALIQPILVGAAYVHFDLREWGVQPANWVLERFGYSLGWSMLVVSDSILGLSFALHLAAAKQFDGALLRLFQPFGPAIRWGAGRSFTLYLMHQPVLFVLTALMLSFAEGPWRPALILAGTVTVPLLMAPMIEVQRHRLRPWVERFQNHFAPPPAVLIQQPARLI